MFLFIWEEIDGFVEYVELCFFFFGEIVCNVGDVVGGLFVVRFGLVCVFMVV